MSTFYGGVVTAKGREVFAQILAARAQLKITDVMFGSGRLPEGTDPRDLTDLVQPVAAGTCTEPNYKGNTVYLTVEYRSDLNGGLSTDFPVNEFGVFMRDVAGQRVMAYYGSLGDYPQWAKAFTPGGAPDVRRFPVGIEIGEGQEVQLEFSSQMFLTSEDVRVLCKNSILPEFLAGDVAAALSAHDADSMAHPALREADAGLEARLSLLEMMYSTIVKENPFTVQFNSLEGLAVAGVWDQSGQRIGF